MRRFDEYTFDLLQNRDIQRLARRKAHHFAVNRLEHSLAAARFSYVVARLLNANARICARAGLLHDWFFENRDEHQNRAGANIHHYKISAANARGIGEPEAVIRAIETHMWLYVRGRPRSKEAWIVWMADNVVWLTDGVWSLIRYTKKKLRNFIYGPSAQHESHAS
ncbi:MAG: HDIG domain-containing metalloprotein [Candidatus Kerfeldbacteria bacterium]